MDESLDYFVPDWPTPSNIKSLISTRCHGYSHGVYGGGNLALHVGDDPQSVALNRSVLALSSQVNNWQWLTQVHGTHVVEATQQSVGIAVEADGSFTRESGIVCAVLTADCLPVLLCSGGGDQIAAVHVGWRGLCGGILFEAISRFQTTAKNICVYLGPAISASAFEVGEDVKLAFALSLEHLGVDARARGDALRHCFVSKHGSPGKYWADLYQMALVHLRHLGVTQIYGGDFCTYRQSDQFYSFRKEGITGRFVSAIWLDD